MYDNIQRQLQMRSELLCSGRFPELVEFYRVPFVVYQDDIPVFIDDRSKALRAFSKVASLLRSRGVVGLNAEVTSVETPKNKRFRVWSCYTEINDCGDAGSQSDVVQYFVETPRGPRVEMLEFLKCPSAAIWEPAVANAS